MSDVRVLPIVPLKNTVIFPILAYPVSIVRDQTIRAVEYALEDEQLMAVFSQKDPEIDSPLQEELFEVGSMVRIVKNVKMPGDKRSVILEGVQRVRLLELFQEDGVLLAKVEVVHHSSSESLLYNKRDELRKMAEQVFDLSPNISNDATFLVRNSADDSNRLTDVIAMQLGLSNGEKQEVLNLVDVEQRLDRVQMLLEKELQRLQLLDKIQNKVRGDIDKAQRDYVLREQLKAIQSELNDVDDENDAEEIRTKITEANMPQDVQDVANKELRRLVKMNPSSAEYTVARTYIDWLVDLPWSVSTEDSLDIHKAQTILDEDHFGLEKVKKRIVEFLAVRQLKSDLKGPILCLVGPPGVGKTSLAKSIARAMDRKMVRMSLGGMRDESEIRGHRRTYIGSMPGKIVKNIKKVASNNPVFVLDEIDKLGNDHRGDPSSALLEVLDPEQNNTFQDHYLDVPFDLSKILFVATANQASQIPAPLRDRMEIIEVSGYTLQEKLQIAKQYIVPEQISEHGLNLEHIDFPDEGINFLIESYTREAGVRSLKREVGALCRFVAKEVALGNENVHIEMTPEQVESIRGPIRYFNDVAERTAISGVSTGLAWTSVGGDILFIESCKMPGKGNVKLSGSLGDVMKESSSVAFSLVRSLSHEIGIDPVQFENQDFHVHVPSGAIPKDGPSAGVTMLTSMVSLLLDLPVNPSLAMTGEITLRGAVLPVGGIKEKVLAAHRAGVKTLILPNKNRKDLPEIPGYIQNELSIHFCEHVRDVLKVALNIEMQ
jgi:ATP-dependent Lon protease